jgi:hypothetical protein
LEGNSCLLWGGAPDSPVHHRTSTVHCPVRISFHSWCSRLGSSGWLAHRTLTGAHQTVRCPLPTVSVGHASRPDCATDRCSSGRWLTGQSGAPPDSPVNYSHTSPQFPESGQFAELSLAHRTLYGAPLDSPVCQTALSLGCPAKSFPFSLFSDSST